MFSILLINNIKIDITNEELPLVQAAIARKDNLIIIGSRSFAYHQFSSILPKEEADFYEKMRLREKGFLRCKRGVIHKINEYCNCIEIGEGDPKIIKNLDENTLLR